jgi:hypothetical protein
LKRSPLDILSRRDFLKRLGGGIIVLWATPTSFASSLEAQERMQRNYPTDFNAYLRIGKMAAFPASPARLRWDRVW